jgi:ATP/maltotriose-dependent transcriptional regulator MalT
MEGGNIDQLLSLTDQQREDLRQYTERSTASAQLAALSLNEQEDTSSVQHFIDIFTGINSYILKYLSDEILYHQPEELHFRASIWYEQKGMISSAIDHALLSGSSERLADILTRQSQPLQKQEVPLIEMLSEREHSVLRLVSEGLSNQEIARNLFLTVSTVKTHLSKIYAKFHVHTRLQAVTKAYDLGLLSSPTGASSAPMKLSDHETNLN